MTGESANSEKMLLAAAIAEGTAVTQLASSNEVPERTANCGKLSDCPRVTQCRLQLVDSGEQFIRRLKKRNSAEGANRLAPLL
jgi:hypothetical protein